jgi:mannose-6-phosphate isomerase-like protein (cupin superfamily)
VPHKALDATDIEAEREGRFRRVRVALGVTAFGINHIHLPPQGQGKEHDESHTGQEEVYFILEGDGVMAVDGELVELRPDRYVFVPAGTMRQVRAGPNGVRFICVGAPPGRGYTPPGPAPAQRTSGPPR